MFKNPVYDMVVVVPALLIAGLLGFMVMTGSAHAAELPPSAATSTSAGSAENASTSGSTLPDPSEAIIAVTRADADPSGPALAALGIRSTVDLERYAKQVIAADSYIASITLSKDEIAVSYQKQGKLLGLVPVPVPTVAHVRTDGSVSFDEPWYGGVTLAERDHMKTALEVRVHALLTSEGYLPSMALAPATQAEILDIIRELLA